MYRAFNIAITTQRKVGEPTLIAGRHAKLHCSTGSGHWQIKRVLKLDLLCLRQSESAADVGKRLLGEDYSAGTHGPNLSYELNVFDSLGEELQATAILFEKSKPRAIDLAIHQQSHQALMAQAGCERQLTLCHVESSVSIAKPLIVQTCYVLERGIAHGRVVTIDVES